MANENVCLFNKFGHCKYRETCRLRHFEEKCENKFCEIENCPLRHPKNCRYFQQFRRCKFGDYCSFAHKIEDFGRKDETLENEVKTCAAKIDAIEKVLEKKSCDTGRMLDVLEHQNVVIAALKESLIDSNLKLTNMEEKIDMLSTNVAKLEENAGGFEIPIDEITNENFSSEKNLGNKPFRQIKPAIENLKHPCNLCENIFETERGLKNHVRSNHHPNS